MLLTPEISQPMSYHGAEAAIQSAARGGQQVGPHFLLNALSGHPDLAGLPMRMGAECQLRAESAENLQTLSRQLRRLMGTDADRLRADLLQGKGRKTWLAPAAVPTLEQMLQVEGTGLRLLLVELLTQIPGQEAGIALASRAVFDLSPEVRQAAVAAQANRPHQGFVAKVFEGLRHPWPAAADHAAQALIALKARETLPALVNMLDLPDPARPFAGVGPGQPLKVREMVRVSHLGNCLLCHAPSLARSDPVPGLIPVPGQPVPRSFSPQYYERELPGRLFVRADITYLKQDFSVTQPVPDGGPWPDPRRFDFLVRERPATTQEVNEWARKPAGASYPQREAALFVLRELTGKDAGERTEGWRRVLPAGPAPPR